jgi:arsenate reductase (thioredoxin)
MNKVLFVCSQNAGRSIMAEAIFNRIIQEKPNLKWEAESVGTAAKGEIHTNVAEILVKKGYKLEDFNSKNIDWNKMQNYQKIISFGCIVKTSLPQEIADVLIEWQIEDPSGKDYTGTLEIYEIIENNVEKLIQDL